MDIEERLTKLEDEVFRLKYDSRVFWRNLSMNAPEWATDAVNAAEKVGLRPSNQGGSHDFYRLLVLMYDQGLLDERS